MRRICSEACGSWMLSEFLVLYFSGCFVHCSFYVSQDDGHDGEFALSYYESRRKRSSGLSQS